MSKFLSAMLLLCLSACAAYKVVPEGELIYQKSTSEIINVTKVNAWAEGNHCFEPMMYVLTVGLIPTHCVDIYSVSSESEELGQVKVTLMQGWVTLLMALFPAWQYGSGSQVESEIRNMVQAAE